MTKTSRGHEETSNGRRRYSSAACISSVSSERLCRRAHAFDLPVRSAALQSVPARYYPRSTIFMSVNSRCDKRFDARLARDPSRPERQVVEDRDRLDMTQFPLPATSLPNSENTPRQHQYSSGARINANSAISRDFMAQSRLKNAPADHAELDNCSNAAFEARSISSMTISSATARPRSICCASVECKRRRLCPALLLRGDAEHRQASEILAGMREAFFSTIFCGIETPDPVR